MGFRVLALVLLLAGLPVAEAAVKAGPNVMGAHHRLRVPSAGGGNDPSFANVILLAHLDGTNGSTTFVDSSAAPHTLTGGVGASLTTAQQKFGTASLQLVSNATTMGVTSPDQADWTIGTNQFTIEAWVRPTVAPAHASCVVSHYGPSNQGWWFGFDTGVFQFLRSSTGSNGTSNTAFSTSYVPATNTWLHIAIDRDATNTARLYANGVQLASVSMPEDFYNVTVPLAIGSDGYGGGGTGDRELEGQIDELRITVGVARYGGAFTPPTAPFPNQ